MMSLGNPTNQAAETFFKSKISLSKWVKLSNLTRLPYPSLQPNFLPHSSGCNAKLNELYVPAEL